MSNEASQIQSKETSGKGPLVIDIETVGLFDELSQEVRDYLIEREAKKLSKDEADPALAASKALPLNPGAGKIAAIGLWGPINNRGAVLVNNECGGRPTSNKFETINDVNVFFGPEAKILTEFWNIVLKKAGAGGKNSEFPLITFNGRAFDGPFLMLRSAMHGIVPTRNLVGYRYSFKDHCDLQEVLTFRGTLPWSSRFSLDFWCHQFGIESPKMDMDGSQVDAVWKSGDLEKLIRYSVADVIATSKLYERLLPLIGFVSENG